MALFFSLSYCQMSCKYTHKLHNQSPPSWAIMLYVRNAVYTTVYWIPPVSQTCRMPARTLKPWDKVGYFRPQLGFTPSDQSRTYGTPDNVQRFISGSLSDPKSSRQFPQFPQGCSSQQLSWQSFDGPNSGPQRAWSMQTPPRSRPSYPPYGGGGGRGGYGGTPPEDLRNGEI